MKKTLVIAIKEYKGFFTGLTAYIVGGLMVGILGYMFSVILVTFSQQTFMQQQRSGQGLNLTEFMVGPHFGNINVILLFFVPPVMMRLMSDEYRNRTMDLLMTSPITATNIVVGKFLAGVMFVWTILGVIAIHPLVVSLFAKLDKGPFITAYIGIMLCAAVYVAVCLFTSSLSENPVIGAVMGFIFCLFLWIIGWSAHGVENEMFRNVLNNLSVTTHFRDFTLGIINTQGVIYYLSLIFFFCFLSQRVIESARWR
jgi:ABC-2 type transport system permease protein